MQPGVASVMYRFFIIPVIAGIVAFLLIYFISPVIISEPGIVSIVARFAINSSTLYFEDTPPVIADYIASLNLATVALTAGLLTSMVVQLLAIIWVMLSCTAKRIVCYLQKNRKRDEPRDLPPIEMDSSFTTSKIGNGVFGRGLDTIDRN
jgi:hypothetical protein